MSIRCRGHDSCYQRWGIVLPLLSPTHRQEIAMNLRPLGDRLVVQRFEAEDKTAGGIVPPDSAKNKPQKGKVVAVAAGRMLKAGSRRPLQVKKGDTVLFPAWAGDEFK